MFRIWQMEARKTKGEEYVAWVSGLPEGPGERRFELETHDTQAREYDIGET